MTWRKREIEAMKLALEALEMAHELEEGYGVDFKKYGLEFDKDIRAKYATAIAVIKEVLAQPEQTEVQRLIALVRAQQITIDKLEMALAQPAPLQEPIGTLNIWFYKGHGNYDFDYWGSLGEGTYTVHVAKSETPSHNSTCNETLRAQGKAYPRTCKKCGLGPCIGKPKFDTTPPAAPVQEIDWKDMYEKEKRRSEMWIAKYEKDIGPLEKAGPVAAQPEQEPVTKVTVNTHGAFCTEVKIGELPHGEYFLCTTPPQRTWVGLTYEERNTITRHHAYVDNIIKATEAKLKEKNSAT